MWAGSLALAACMVEPGSCRAASLAMYVELYKHTKREIEKQIVHAYVGWGMGPGLDRCTCSRTRVVKDADSFHESHTLSHSSM